MQNRNQIPLFFLFCQLLIAVFLLQLCALFGASRLSPRAQPLTDLDGPLAGYMKLPRLDITTCKGLAPLIGCNVLGLAFNTYCLRAFRSRRLCACSADVYTMHRIRRRVVLRAFESAGLVRMRARKADALGVHPQQIARGLVLPFTVFFSWYILGSKSSRATLTAVGIVCIGFMLGVSGEIHTTLLGTTLGVASSVTTAVHAIVVKRSLGVVSGTLDLAYYTNLLSAIVILPFVILSGEIWTVVEMVAGNGDGAEAFGTFMTGAAVTVRRLSPSLRKLLEWRTLTRGDADRACSASSSASPASSRSRSPRPSRT